MGAASMGVRTVAMAVDGLLPTFGISAEDHMGVVRIVAVRIPQRPEHQQAHHQSPEAPSRHLSGRV